MAETSMRDRIAIVLALTEDLVSPPRGGKYYRYADAILPLIEEAVTAERERFRSHLMEFVGDDGTLDQHVVANLDSIRGGESE